ncbi:MAG: class I SAM-dependent methyltransferase [Polynucleobacter sp.]|nr:class I SAM-dependent methyltransferase [Polynucleobacter sp.]
MISPNDISRTSCEKTEYGFYQYRPLPSKAELQEYYSQKYYQQGKGSYDVAYTLEEINYFRLKAELIYKKLSHLRDLGEKKDVLDIGCGEGWVLDQFAKQRHNVTGIDYSQYGLNAFNSHMLPFLEQGDCVELILAKVNNCQRYDVVILANVIEHVLNPVDLVEKIYNLLAEDGILIIVAPNDFSLLHKHLEDNKIIDRQFWLAYPDHISYFNKESMENLVSAKGFNVVAVVADNPVDLNLLNMNSNYVQHPEKGKGTHFFRVSMDNFLAGISKDRLLDCYETLGSMGVGRDLTYFCSK